MVPYGDFAPDRFEAGALVSPVANGVLPTSDGYGPWPSLSAISVALGDVCVGAISVVDNAGTNKTFAFTRTKAYKYVGPTDNWTEVTRASGGDYNCPTDYLWSLALFGSTLIACNQNDDPQAIDINSGTNFAALGGSPPKAGIVQVVGDFVFLGNLLDYPDRIVWSGRNDPTFWTFGYQDSDYQIFPSGGLIRGITNIQGGLVLLDHAIWRFTPTSDRLIFLFQPITDSVGLLADSSLVTIGYWSYFYADSGFYACSAAGELRRIGTNRLDKWFISHINADRRYAIRGCRDPNRNRVFWIAPTPENTSQYMDFAVCYDADLDRWSYNDAMSASVLLTATTPAWTTDTIDDLFTALGITSEDATFSLDQRWLDGGTPYLAAFGSDDKLGLLTGVPVAATIETGAFQPVPGGQRAVINEVWPKDDAAAGSVTLGKAESVQADATFGSASTMNARGKCSIRSSGRWHRVRRSIPAGTTWNNALGVDVMAVTDGMR